MARALGGTNATAAISRTHAEIEHQLGRLRRLLTDLDDEAAQPENVVELRRLLYGLYAVLPLHNAQEEEEEEEEEEGAFSLVPNGAANGPGGRRRSRNRRCHGCQLMDEADDPPGA